MTTKRLLLLVGGGTILVAMVLVVVAARALREMRMNSLRDRAAAEASPEPQSGEVADAHWFHPGLPIGTRTSSRGGATRLEAHLSPWPRGATASVICELKEEGEKGLVALGSARTSRGRLFFEGVPAGKFTLSVRAPNVGFGTTSVEVPAGAPAVSVGVDLQGFGTLVVEGCKFFDDGTILVLGEGKDHRMDLSGKSSASLDFSWEWRKGDAALVDLEPGRWEVIGVNAAGPFAEGPFDIAAGERRTVVPDVSTVVMVEVAGADADSHELVSIVGADGTPRRLVSLGPGRRHDVSPSGALRVTGGERILVRSEKGLHLQAVAWSDKVALPDSGTLRWEMP